jgi:hypothetical protein
MTSSDRIGNHGEFVFQALISRRCRDRFYFHPVHLGEKHPTIDMVVELLDPTNVKSLFYVQIKSTALGYTGSGSSERLRVTITSEDIERLKAFPGPSYIAGIDIVKGRGFLVGIVTSLNGPLNGLPTIHRLDCRNFRTLWNEVDAYWNFSDRLIPMASTRFRL